MTISCKVDEDQNDKSIRENLALCPYCGQKLFEVESLHTRGVFRQKCRRCKKYIRVTAIGTED